MARKRFTPAERGIITAGARIEWQNVTQWHPVTVTDGVVRLDYGWQYVTVRCDETRGNVRRGDVIHAGPGKIRVPASKTLGEMTAGERAAAVRRAAGKFQRELDATGPAIGRIIDVNERQEQ